MIILLLISIFLLVLFTGIFQVYHINNVAFDCVDVIMRETKFLIRSNNEIKRLISKNERPQIFMKGQSMNGKYFIVTVARPALTAGDIKEVV